MLCYQIVEGRTMSDSQSLLTCPKAVQHNIELSYYAP